MSPEGFRPDDKDRQNSKVPFSKEVRDIFVPFGSELSITYPTLEEIKSNFPTRRHATTENVRIGRMLEECTQDKTFAEYDSSGETISFYEGAYAAAQLARADKKFPLFSGISTEAVVECIDTMKIKRTFWGMTVQNHWLRQNEQISNDDKRDDPLSVKILGLAFDRQYPKAFVAGATVVLDLYRTEEELKQAKEFPRQNALEIYPLYIDAIADCFTALMMDTNNAWDGLKSMQRENQFLFRYIRKKFDYMEKVEPDKSKTFMLGALAAYNLFRMSAEVEGKIPAEVPLSFLALDMYERPVREKSENERVFSDCDDETNFLCETDEQYDDLWDCFGEYENVLTQDAIEGMLNGYALVLRAFRSAMECDLLENTPIDKSKETALLLNEREARARESRMQSEQEMDRKIEQTILQIFDKGSKTDEPESSN